MLRPLSGGSDTAPLGIWRNTSIEEVAFKLHCQEEEGVIGGKAGAESGL